MTMSYQILGRSLDNQSKFYSDDAAFKPMLDSETRQFNKVGSAFDVIFLLLVVVVGSLGNLLLIFSIIYDKKVHQNGNIFIINLAVADLLICGVFAPSIIANVISQENTLPMGSCHFIGYLITMTAPCSLWNLLIIAVSRYWNVARGRSYSKIFSTRNTWIMVFCVWAWANLLAIPPFFGWGAFRYDEALMACSFDDVISTSYDVFLIMNAMIIPLLIITFFYWRLFRSVKKQGLKVTSQQTLSIVTTLQAKQAKLRMKREMYLLKSTAATVIAVVISWLPFAIVVLFFATTAPAQLKRASARLGVSNSAMNFIIYGVLNPVYRKAYKKLIHRLWCCKSGFRRIFGPSEGQNDNKAADLPTVSNKVWTSSEKSSSRF